MNIEVKVPAVGESISSGILSVWHKKDGEPVRKDEPLFTLETDKVSQEVTAPEAGVVHLKAAEGDEVKIGQVVAEIAPGEAPAAPKAAAKKSSPAKPAAPASAPAPVAPRRPQGARQPSAWEQPGCPPSRLQRPAGPVRGAAVPVPFPWPQARQTAPRHGHRAQLGARPLR